ncbi:MAG: hypothetical protein ASARMPREDX12_001855 [Alectoria sarmentosa]|nr:MAG: hypothetical protein ASARMPREDX12_001855 [Alectoria sarmentosa]
MDKFQAFGKNITSSFSPFAARTQQYVKEQLGTADDKTELPPDYIELEKRVDALKQVHQKLLQVTSQYSNEAYDYPPNIRESFNDLGRTITDKVNLLSHAKSPGEAQAAFTAPPSAKPQPKTFPHAIARASLVGSQLLIQTNPSSSNGEDPLATALEKYALASEKVGEARLAQDQQIQQRFLAGWSTTLNTNLMFATRARRGVENARLGLDATKAKGKGGKGEEDLPMSDEHRAEVERKEDEFVGVTEEAVGVMKNVLDTPEPLRNLADLIAAQLEYYKKAYEILSELAPVVDGLQVEQEASYSPTAPNITLLTTHLTAPPAATKPKAVKYPQPSSILNASIFWTATAHATPRRTQSTPPPCVERRPNTDFMLELLKKDSVVEVVLVASDVSPYFQTTIKMGNKDMQELTNRAVEMELGVGFFGGAGSGAMLPNDGQPTDGQVLRERGEGTEKEVEGVLEEYGKRWDGRIGCEGCRKGFDVGPGQVDIEEEKKGAEAGDGGLM